MTTTLQKIYAKIFDNGTKKIKAKSVRDAFALMDDKIEKVESGIKGVLKKGDPKPAPDAIGKYELADIGEYTNLVPIIPFGGTEAQNTPITTEDGFYNAVYWDGVNFTQINIEMPKNPITTEFKTVDTTEFVEDSEFDIDWVKGGFIFLTAQQVQANLSYMYAERIDLLQNTEIYVSGVFGGDNGILIYDNNGVVLKRIDATVTGNQDSQTLNFKIDIPEGGSYMSFSTRIDAVNKVVGRYYKRITKDFDDFYREFSKSITIEKNDKEFDDLEAVWIPGFYYNIYTTDSILNVGTKVSDAAFQYAQVSVIGINLIKVSVGLGVNQGIICYNSQGQLIKVISHTAINATIPVGSQLTEEIVHLPENTDYIIIDSQITAISKVSGVTSRHIVEKTSIANIYNQGLVIGGYEDLFNTIDWVQGEKILNIGGGKVPDIAWKRSDFIAVKKGDRFKVKLRGDLFSPIVTMYASDNFESYSNMIANYTSSNIAENVETEIVIEKKGFVIFQIRTLDYFVDDLYVKKYNSDYFYYNSVADLKKEFSKNGLLRNYFRDNISIEKPTEIFLTGEMPQDISENRVATQLAFSLRKNGNEICKGFTNLAIQGQGSAVYLKKGYTFDVLNESGNSMKIKFGDMISTDSFNLKAYATDPTHTRDVGNARIWRDMINFLDYPQSKVNNMEIGLSLTTNENEAYNQDAKYYTEGFPVRVFLNGVFFGLYTMRNKKTRENYSLNNKNKKHIFLDSATKTAYLGESFDPTDWEIKSPKMTGYVDGGATVPDTTVLTNINRLFYFTRNLTTTYQNHADYIVLNHWVVWIIFSELISNRDTNGNNYNLITWDGLHWSIIPYDLDLTLGLNPWDNSNYTVELSRKQFDVNHDIWATFKTVYLMQIKAMYKKLRESGFLTVQNLSKYYQNIGTKISRSDYAKDAAIWGNIWSNSIPTVEQIDLFLKNKIDFLDTKWL
ncbi:hypothetical protein HER18_02970 [Chryseobacterium sp. NEB161]|nr:hypothetical protein HER18_02970 [Chryseobacterium sp. NEB161]